MTPRRSISTLLAPAILAAVLAGGCTGGGGGGGGGGGATSPGATTPSPGGPSVLLQLGADVPAERAARMEQLIRGAAVRPVVLVAPADPIAAPPAGSLVIAIGETSVTRAMIPPADVTAQGSEGFVVRSRTGADGTTRIAADGNARLPDPHGLGAAAGLLYGSYALLEELGFGFLHPLAPISPSAGLRVARDPVDLAEAPRWPVRGWHLHTMHPIELTDVLNGWGPGGPADQAGWRAQLPEWDRFCEWMIANRQNHVEWYLLMAQSWAAFADSPERQDRLRELVDLAHGWGIVCGADTPIAQRQQHSWHLLRRGGTGVLADEIDEIEMRLDWLMAVGFDFVATELGFSEFTHPTDVRMVAWLDAATAHLADVHGKEIYAKIHVSTGQEAPSFLDPDTGLPTNFNFLPAFADPRLGVMPHTVQHYGIDDEVDTYGRSDFDDIREFLQEEAGKRRVLWHAETAYWVSFDIDVPLFLPVYAERRLHDLRVIAADERAGRVGRGPHAGTSIDGQMNFSSGWEWGYWLNDVVTARAAWNPFESEPTDEAALRRALDPLTRLAGSQGAALEDLLVATTSGQYELLIEGRVNGQRPASVQRRTGQAYLQGWETWDDAASLVARLPVLDFFTPTQPHRLDLVEMRRIGGILAGVNYTREVEPLLAEMEQRFTQQADAFGALAAVAPVEVRPLVDEMADGARMNALRATQAHGLYDFVDLRNDPDPAVPAARLAQARAALDAAIPIVVRREAAYRVPADRIAGWRENPTAYEFGYLWTARSLVYWWRDEGKAVDAPINPSYLNFIDPLDVGFGEGYWTGLTAFARAYGSANGLNDITDFLSVPPQEPSYPAAQPGLRSRP